MKRIQEKQIEKDLAKKIVFLVGPRQVGKTWLAKKIGKEIKKTVYLNYDRLEDREIILKEQWLPDTNLLILDELHKMAGWKNYLKGVFDTKPNDLKILVTGSARLDTFRQSGDSLAGRYFVHHLLPLSLSEIKQTEEGIDFDRLIKRGGFPEPYLASSDVEANRWRNQYIDGLIREDILNFEKIDDLRAIQTIFNLLRGKVGAPISYSSLARDAEISPTTVKKYIKILEALYIIFRVPPYTKKIARAILKEPKIYFYDNGLVEGDEGKKLENLVAVSLLKNILGRNDYLGEKNKLFYLNTKEKKEVDFAIASEEKMGEIIEVKLSDSDISKNLRYFSDKYNFLAKQIVKNLKREKRVDDIEVIRAQDFLENLYL
jgi:predicted AAA+ superfamily ATPase